MNQRPTFHRVRPLGTPAVAALLAAAVLGICLLAPTESTMGDAQRIVYLHVALAWFALAAFVATAATGAAYLLRRSLDWDEWSQAAAEVGWLCCGLTLLTGSLWARQAWGTWWTWDPRLTTAFVLWTIYSGYLIVRSQCDDPHRRARVAAAVAIMGTLDIPLVIVAARWFRGMHPASPEMDPAMRLVLLLGVAGFTGAWSLLVIRRRVQLRLERRLATLAAETAD
jgi:heme exporter protein C